MRRANSACCLELVAARWLLRCQLIAAMLACAMLAACGGQEASATAVLDTAEAVLVPEAAPAREERVALRHRWDKAFPGQAGRATYRLVLPAAPLREPFALFFEQVGNQAEVRVNGRVLQRIGVLGDARVDGGKTGQSVVVPVAVRRSERDGRDELVVEASMQALRGGGLGRVHVGSLAAIEALEARRRVVEVAAPAAYAASLMLMGGLAAGLWWRQRVALYGCFSLAALFGVLRHIDHLWLAVPLPWPLWGALLAIGYGCQLAFIARFVLLLLDRDPRWLVRAIQVAIGLVLVLAPLSFWLGMPVLWTAALALLEGVGLAAFGVVLNEAWRGRQRIAWFLLGAGGIVLAAGTHDFLFVRLAWHGGASTPLTPHAMFFFVLILAGVVVQRHNRSVADYRALNEHLAERVAERERQLVEASDALRVQQQEQAVLTERQRIMREIHDGIGSQLVGLLGMVGQPHADPAALEEQVQYALDEMRMAVDSLQPVHSDLATVLATLRYRLQPRLQAAGIEVVWDVAALPPMVQLSPQAILQMQRILLEAFTNVLKHAHASRVTVHAHWHGADAANAEAAIVLKLSDDGVGLEAGLAANSAASADRGHGLRNMRARASAIGASLQIDNLTGGGTGLVLEWPIRG